MANKHERFAAFRHFKARRVLAFAMALVLSLSLVNISVLAVSMTDAEGEQAKAQIMGCETSGQTSSAKYYETVYDEKTNSYEFGTTLSSNPCTSNIDGTNDSEKDVVISKEIMPTGEENLFNITLNVQTNQTVSTTTTYPDAAVVLIIDISSSMDADSVGKMKDAGSDFIDKFADSANGAKRQVAVVTYNKNVYSTSNGWVDVTNQNAKDALKAALKKITTDGGTNTQGGLLMAYNLLKSTTVSSFGYKTAVLMTDGAPNTIVTSGEKAVNPDINVTTGTLIGSYYYYDANDGKGSQDWSTEPKYNGNDWWKDSTFKATTQKMRGRGDPSLYAAYRAKQVADQIKALPNTTLYTIGYSISTLNSDKSNMDTNNSIYDAAYTVPYTVTNNKRNYDSRIIACEDWLKSLTANPNTNYFKAALSSLQSSFTAIVNEITLSASAWMVTDPMGTNIEIVPSSISDDPGAKISGATLSWNLHQANDTGNNGQHIYTMTYQIRLNAAAPTFTSGKYYKTNGLTSLTYYIKDSNGKYVDNNHNAVNSDKALLTMYFKVPAVKGYLGELSFTKVDAYRSDTHLSGAEFTLHPVGVSGTAKDIVATSGADGKVAFTAAQGKAIPSGQVYTMTETGVPENYDSTKTSAYRVTVAYGAVTAEKAASGGSTSDMTVTNTLDSKNVSITLKKVWQQPAGAAKTDVTVDLYCVAGQKDATPGVKADGDSAADVLVNTYTIPVSGTQTVSVPTINVADGTNCTYYMVETAPASGYTKTYSTDITPATAETAEGKTLTVTNTITDSSSITVSKNWVTVDGYATATKVVLLQNDEIYKTCDFTASNLSETFDKCPTYDANGNTINYTVAEWVGDTNKNGIVDKDELATTGDITLGGHVYTVSVSGTTVTNTLKQENVTVAGTKTWVDGNSVVRPEELTVTLKKGTATVTTQTTDAKKGWSYNFSSLPLYDEVTAADGTVTGYTVNTYSVTDSVDGYTVSGGSKVTADGQDSYDLKNTIAQDYVNVVASKTWEDSDNADSTRPANITVELYRGTSKIDEVVLDGTADEAGETDSWEVTFSGLDKYDLSTGLHYTYTVKEAGVNASGDLYLGEADSHYDCTIGADTDASDDFAYLITNTLTGDTTSVTVAKHWVDFGAKTRSTATITLTGSNGSTATHDFTGADASESYTFTDLPKYANGSAIVYTASETGVPSGYTCVKASSSNDFYNYLTQVSDVTVTGTKIWVDNGVARPTSVTVQLQSDAAVDGTFTNVSDKTDVIGTTFIFENLPRYAYTHSTTEAGVVVGIREIDYQVTDSVTNYTPSGGTKTTGVTADVTYDLTNTFQQEYFSISGTKTWIDGGKNHASDTVYVGLFRNGAKIETATVSNGIFTFGKNGDADTLPKYSDSAKTEYNYVVKELADENDTTGILGGGTYADDYTVSYLGTYGEQITNKLSTIDTSTGSATITKTWKAPDSVIPDSITFDLYRSSNGSAPVDTGTDVTVLKTEKWTKTVNGIATRDASGYPYTYSFVEQGVKDGKAIIKDVAFNVTANDAKTAYTNTIQQEEVSVTGAKSWTDATDSILPGSICVQLYRDGASMGEKYNMEVTANDSWKYSFTNLDKYALGENENGHVIAYTVKEGYYANNANDANDAKTWYAIEDNGTIQFSEPTGKYTFTASYTSGDDTADTLIRNITNSYNNQATELYTYRVDRVYNYYRDGSLVDIASSKIVGGSRSGTANQVVTLSDSDITGYKMADGFGVYAFVSGVPTVTEGEGATAVTKIGVTLTETGEYVITLTYEYRATSSSDDDDDDHPSHPTDPKDPGTDIPDDPTPLDPIPVNDPTVPDKPGKGLVDIEDPKVPLASADASSKTGDSLALWIAAAGVSGLSLLWFALTGRKRSEDSGAQ